MLLALLEHVIGGILVEGNVDVPGGQLFESVLNCIDSLLQEVLLSLVKGDFSNLRSIESNSHSVADDDAGQQELSQKGFLNISQGSAKGSLLSFVFLHPSRLDVSVGNQEDSGFELLLQLSNELLVERSQQNFVAAVREIYKSSWFFLAVGDLDDLVNLKELTVPLVVGIELRNNFLKGSTGLLLNCGVLGVLAGFGPGENCGWLFSGVHMVKNKSNIYF